MRFDCGASESKVKYGNLGRGAVDGVGRGRGIDHRDGDGVDAGGDQVVHDALLDGGVGTLGIAEAERDVGQFALGLLHAGFGELPEVRRPVHDEGDLRLVLRDRRRAEHEACRAERGNNLHVLHVVLPLTRLAGRFVSRMPPSQGCSRARDPASPLIRAGSLHGAQILVNGKARASRETCFRPEWGETILLSTMA